MQQLLQELAEMSTQVAGNWLILLPQLPPQPSSLRVRVWRRLQQIGAVALKNAAYALPNTESALEDFQWLSQEILDAGGGVLLLRAEGLGEADEEIRAQFSAERTQEYRKLGEEADGLRESWRNEKDLPPEMLVNGERLIRQLRERHSRLREIDFFDCPAASDALNSIESACQAYSSRIDPGSETSVAIVPLSSALWVTRAGVYVDRLACAWLIRRFVDPGARIVTVPPSEALPAGATPFDMKGVEFGHHASRCSAETMALYFRPEDKALRAVAEVVHDLDLKDEGFGRPEAPGLKRLLDGICAATDDDQVRIERATPIFEALYLGFGDESIGKKGV
jgi:hypothetical protein